ncbi:MAG: hypothetical protein J5845_02825 [Lachnospiraceae bacterium]|nr:hypothetical protein [Lachnospiraceae bacterium]
MKKLIRLAGVMVMALALAGCGKDKQKKATPTPEPTPDVTVTVTAEPTPETSGTRTPVVSLPVVYGAGDDGWICQGMLTVDTDDLLPASFGKGTEHIAGTLTEYRVQNNANTELFRVTGTVTEQGIVFTLKIGAYERRIKTVAESEEGNTIDVIRFTERMVLRQNGSDLLAFAADADALTVGANGNEGAWAFRFPVQNGIVAETDASGSLYLGEDMLSKKVAGLKDIYDGSYLAKMEDRIRAEAATEERSADYVQVTKKRVTADGRWTEYNVIYQSNTVIVDRSESGSKQVTEYEFRELSNGISEAAYFANTVDAKPEYTFAVEELDEFRSEIYGNTEREERDEAEFLRGRIPFIIVPTEYGYMERGYRKDGDTREDYIRLCFCDGTVSGSVYAVYNDTDAVSVRVIRLGAADGRVYADGIIYAFSADSSQKAASPRRELHEYTYDRFGVMTKETKPGYSATYEYAFSDFAYGGADDTIRHEWQNLMPYLEKALQAKEAARKEAERKEAEQKETEQEEP